MTQLHYWRCVKKEQQSNCTFDLNASNKRSVEFGSPKKTREVCEKFNCPRCTYFKRSVPFIEKRIYSQYLCLFLCFSEYCSQWSSICQCSNVKKRSRGHTMGRNQKCFVYGLIGPDLINFSCTNDQTFLTRHSLKSKSIALILTKPLILITDGMVSFNGLSDHMVKRKIPTKCKSR